MTRKEVLMWAVLIVLSALLTSGFISAASYLEQKDWAEAQPWIERARSDLSANPGVDPQGIRVQSVEAVEFPDSSLGVRKPGEFYLTVMTPGYVIKLVSGGETYVYHAGANRVVRAG